MRKCKYCEVEFEPKHPKAEFHTTRCRVEWHRQQARGAKEAPEKSPAEKIPEKNSGKEPAWGRPFPEGMGETRRAVTAGECHPKGAKPPAPEDFGIKVASVAPAKKKPRLWPADMKADEVGARLMRMRDYNATMKRQGTPQFCSTREFVVERLREVGADEKLVKIVFP